MPDPICNADTFVRQASCYLVPPLNEAQQKALIVYAKVLELAAIGGSNYTNQLTGSLITDAKSATCGMKQENRDAARVNIAFRNADEAGAPIPLTLQAKLAAVRCLVEANAADGGLLDEMDLLLTCKLGRAMAYPQ